MLWLSLLKRSQVISQFRSIRALEPKIKASKPPKLSMRTLPLSSAVKMSVFVHSYRGLFLPNNIKKNKANTYIITWPFCCCCFMDCFWWTNRCFFRFEYCEYDLEHSGHVCGRIPRCTISCFLRLARCENALSQLLHLNGFSPGCNEICSH